MNNIILFIGGMDPSGGAGLPADLKTASVLGFHGCPAVTAVTVQNSGNVLSWEAVVPEVLMKQLKAVCDDGPVAGVKSGMLGSTENASALALFIREELRGIPYVLDPVLKAGGGGSLVGSGMIDLMRDQLVPLCTLCTPNIDEAEILSGTSISNTEDMIEAGRIIISMGAEAVLVKGGHLAGDPVDLLVTKNDHTRFSGSRITAENVHGTGCTLAAAAASLLAAGFSMETAIRDARIFVRRVINRRIERVHGNLPGHSPGAGPLPLAPDGTSFYLPPAFCSMCGGKLGKSPGEHGHLFCRQCGFIHYRNPLPAVVLLVHDFERVLLVRRAVQPKKGMLSLPGGFLETGETPEECGRRELMEETGLHARDSRLLGVETDMTAYGGIILAVLEVKEWEGTLLAGDDASEAMWCPIREVPELAFSAHNRLVKELANTL
ncbi:bifunctional hydroxymethylpyrimidine kinase/phosphomethylpyrimidine kinase [Candidatus Fermentibacteria bacterium]|nr:MAG: bifunctional hydroxymethylpyrimidine kinase/phosphomethylpyrimidine kinase [Candidatus Fermentibacteria bacterium]